METEIAKTIIKFPELMLMTRDSHKLRGYFGNLFKDESPLLHNHYDDGTNIYKYPLVQYKVINQVPVLVGLKDGAELLEDLFFRITDLNIEGRHFKIESKNIEKWHDKISITANKYKYTFQTLWMGLNDKNFKKYLQSEGKQEKTEIIKRVLTGNIISFFKGINYQAEEKIIVSPMLEEGETKFKNKKMLAFKGGFYSNAALPSYIGLGKSVSRGFGTISSPLLIKINMYAEQIFN